jgi:hypothetical protein
MPRPDWRLRFSVIVLVVVLVAVTSGAFVRQQRQIGAQRVLLHQADSSHHADSVASVKLTRIALAATARADLARQAFRDAEAGQRTVAEAREAAVGRLAIARDSALAVAQDSTATVVELRRQVERLVGASDSAELSHAREVEALRHSLRLAALTIEADSTAIARGLAAVNGATARAVAAETQARLLRRMLPSTVRGWAKLGAVGALGYLIGSAK